MNILAVDSTSKNVSIVLSQKENVSIKSLDSFRNTSELLLPKIDELLNENNLNLNDLDCLVLNIGPGSFTGIRIAMSLFKGFMCCTNLKCVTVNSFDLLSYNINDDNFVCVIDSGTSDYYCMGYDKGFKRFFAVTKEELEELDKKYKVYSDLDLEGILYEKKTVNPLIILDIAKEKIEKCEFVDEFHLEPLYIKKAQAEKEYKVKFLNSISLENAKEENIKDILVLEEKYFKEEAYSENELKKDIENNVFLVAKTDSTIIGYINVLKTDVNEILKICVDENFRNLGVANALIEKIFELTQNDIILEVSSVNPAKDFYLRIGFEVFNVRKKYYKNLSDAICMRKNFK